MAQFRYLPLPPVAESGPTPPFTRILYLAPGTTDEEPFNGHLETINVEHAPPYEALSYTWGREDASDFLWIGGIPLPIRPNLATALQSLRLQIQARRLWVDAVCIDQENPDERSRQVQYMRLVYKHAARVIVWLGPRAFGVEEAFRAAERISRTRELTRPAAAGRESDPHTLTELRRSMLGEIPADSMASLGELLARPYFTRCWCVQEVAASSWAVARCGDLEMPFFDILSSTLAVATWRNQIQADNSMALWGFLALHREGWPGVKAPRAEGSMGSLLSVLGMARDIAASDDRDKIFSLLGICDEGLRPVLASTQVAGPASNGWFLETMRRGITRLDNYANRRIPGKNSGRPRALIPDYTRDTVSVYCDLARFLVQQPPRMLDALNHVQHRGDPEQGPFPSWVPKWFEPNSTFVASGSFKAGLCGGHFRYLAELHDCPSKGEPARSRVLSLDGFRFDTVEAMSEVFVSGSSDEEAVSVMRQVWHQLFQVPLFPRTNMRYRDGQPLDEAFCKALSAAPLGSTMGSMLIQSSPSLGLHLDMRSLGNETKEQREKLTRDMVDAFFQGHEYAADGNNPSGAEATTLLSGYLAGVKWFSHGRRAFRTRDGRLGVGPRVMQPGDELVVLFGGRLPFVVRPRMGHHVFVGACYVVDEEVMWGKATERVRLSKGGPPPVQTFELW